MVQDSPNTLHECEQHVDFKGLWQDGKLLVVSREDHLFPDRCIKTNRSFSGNLTKFDLIWSPTKPRGIASTILAAIYMRQATLHVPISDDFQYTSEKKKGRGFNVVRSGMSAFFLSVAVFIVAAFAGVPLHILNLMAILVLVAPIVAFCATFYMMHVLANAAIHASKISDQYVWVKGISKAYLESLPAFDESAKLAGIRAPSLRQHKKSQK